jgi:hypothetical protein
VGVAPSFAFAAWTDFIPTPLDTEAFVDVFTSYERDDLRSGARSARWDDIFIKEKVTLFTYGYSYHPRFLRYQFSIAGIGKQERYDSNVIESGGWTYGSGLEYDVRLTLLPEHFYNLDAFASRYEPVFKEQAATEHDSVATRYGASFRYRKKPYFLHASYTDETVDSDQSSSDVQRVSLDGQYFKRYESGNEISFNGAFNPSWFSNSVGLDGESTEYLLGNLLNLQWAWLNSSLTYSTFDQENRTAERFESEQFTWHERLTTYLPWNFRTDFSYRYQDSDNTIDERGGAFTRRLSDTTRDLQLDVIHKLFQSVDTTYTFLRDSRRSSGGKTTSLSHALSVRYAKHIPTGRLLAGTNLSRTDSDNEGSADVVNEPHPATPVPGSFVLNQENVAPESILVFLRSPLPPFEAILLEENVHYIVVPILNTFEIRVLTLPPQFVVPGTYDFFVSYSLTTGDFELRTDSVGANISFELFNHMLTPYFSYVTVDSDVLSGAFLGTPLDSTTYTAGLIFLRGPWRLRGEYQNLDWDISPQESWRGEIQYVAALNSTTNVYLTASYLNRHFSSGTSASFPVGYTEETSSATGNIRKQLFSRSMYISGGGSYSHVEGPVNSNAYSGNVSFVWTIGRLDVSVGASAYGSDTDGLMTVSTRRDRELVYVRIRRQLF